MNSILAQKVQEFAQDVIEWRHQIHQNPELGFCEFETSNLIEEKLRSFNVDKIQRIGRSKTGICAELYGTGNGPKRCIGLRADIDALPIQEQSGVSYASKKDGVFHGCGHDSHAAILLGTAWLLSELRDQFSGCVKFFFQHAEELSGGGKEFIEAGVMENPHVDGVLALHALPDIYLGEIGVRDDFMTAGIDRIKITVEGKQAHGGYPHYGVDTILAASTIVTTLQSLGSRELAPTDCAFVTFGRIEGGISNAYIGGPVVIEGSIRYLRKTTQERFHRRVREIATNVGQALRAKVTVEITPNIIPTCVDKEWVNRVRRVCRDIESVERVVDLPSPAMGGEDYAYFLEKAPGTFFRLGVRTPGGPHCPTHSIDFYIDDRAIPIGMEVMAAATLDALR
ncbi:MAG: M20 family metallopeptidase [Aminobacterium sp.]|jgi:amidohydrolase|uniref:M20 metallopeptidase family protein n=1 Tax=unclassified Aminobacterium TaxID=2685012 RepID=UPI001BCDC476|nr:MULTISPECIES: M20 family metallopeptidase [unclassified Aminobacterium]MDD2206883.1 M20 family metallopeptidase [Aminobacterium sp.]MDD3425429.1 M20 family metallopeptidase [Aminobacterium sp.]MDD3707930.1 M20 family metallopeptidase [Aminobacterium sp.]MDD4229456.1 M20 family metallopeptidase [Aminobacterium sp.]MDD4550996.1 M20 family metallopeptidase [Aminobacterium sp.]